MTTFDLADRLRRAASPGDRRVWRNMAPDERTPWITLAEAVEEMARAGEFNELVPQKGF